MTNRNRSELVETVTAEARKYIGLRSRANRVNDFGADIGQNGKAWNGSFLERVLFESGVTMGVSPVSTTAALAYFIGQNRTVKKPLPGDIVFYAFSSGDGGFGQPHVGLVTVTADYKNASIFRAVEGMTNSGSPKGPQELDGVYERTRYQSDVLAFVRPVYVDNRAPREVEPLKDIPTVRPANFRHNRVSASTVHLQLALTDLLGPQNFTRGLFDSHTASAVARFQSEVAMLPQTGVPDLDTLTVIMVKTDGRFFNVPQDV